MATGVGASTTGFRDLALNPPSKGRQSKNPNINVDEIPTFVTHTVPPIDKNTRLIAVCGITDSIYDVEKLNFEPGAVHQVIPMHRCDQRAEGWFVADFYCYKILYEGTCASQVWLHCENPKQLVEKHGAYLHGNPYKDRKEVLNEELLAGGLGEDVIIVERNHLKQKFCDLLKQEAQAARANGQKLLVLTLSHGDEETYGVNLGERYNDDHWFTVEDFSNAVAPDHANSSRGTITQTDLEITYLTTACFSGGWTVSTDVNMTIFAAAGPNRESLSWLESPSCCRYSGGIYTTAIRQAWVEESKHAQAIEGSLEPGHQQKTLAGFDKEIYDTLFRIDKKANRHDIRFSAQDDDWNSPWTQRTGSPLAHFEQKWDCLKTVPPTDPLGDLNPSPSNKLNASTQASQASGGFSNRFEHFTAAHQFIIGPVKKYMRSFPGPNNASNNQLLHGTINRLKNPTIEVPLWVLEDVFSQVKYRLLLAQRATWLLKTARIPLPYGLSCNQFNEEEFEDLKAKNPNSDVSKKYNLAVRKIFTSILPDPEAVTQGFRWNKPHHYLAYAIALDSTIKDEAQLQAAVRRLEQVAAAAFKQVQKDIECNGEIRSRKRDLFARIGKRVRSLSPDRIRRKRADTGTPKLGNIPELLSHPTSAEGKGKERSLW